MKRLVRSTGSFSPLRHHVDQALVRGVAAGEELAGEQQALARLPGRDLGLGRACRGSRAGSLRGVERELRPVVERGRLELRRAAAVEHEVRVARGGAVGQQRHRLARPRASGSRSPSRRARWRGRPGPARRCRARSPSRRARGAAPRRGSSAPRAFSSWMLSGSIIAHLAISIAFSGEPPMPSESMPGGHQSAPMVGTMRQHPVDDRVATAAASRTCDLFSQPPPLAATITSTLSPGTSSTCVTAGVLSPVLLRLPSGSASIEARSGLSLSV